MTPEYRQRFMVEPLRRLLETETERREDAVFWKADRRPVPLAIWAAAELPAVPPGQRAAIESHRLEAEERSRYPSALTLEKPLDG